MLGWGTYLRFEPSWCDCIMFSGKTLHCQCLSPSRCINMSPLVGATSDKLQATSDELASHPVEEAAILLLTSVYTDTAVTSPGGWYNGAQ